MKKILVSLLVLCLAFSFTACGSSTNNADAGNNDVVETEAPVVEETEAVEPETEAVVEETEAVVEEPAVVYTYTDLSQTMYAKKDVNVRDLPSVEGNKVDGLSFAEEVTVTGKCNETGWYRINYGGKDAYVSNNYLVSEKPVPQEPATESVAQESVQSELTPAPWALYTPEYNMSWDCMTFYCPESEVGTYEYNVCYTNACLIMKWHSGASDCYHLTMPVGTYAEGNIIMVMVYGVY